MIACKMHGKYILEINRPEKGVVGGNYGSYAWKGELGSCGRLLKTSNWFSSVKNAGGNSIGAAPNL